MEELAFLKQEYPHLIRIQQEINKITNSTGYGEVSISLRMVNGLVDKISILTTSEEILIKRKQNQLTK